MKITARKDSIVRIDCEAIVNPSNSFGFMGGGVAKVLKDTGGEKIEEEAIGHAPVEIGTALATAAGDLKCTAIIHSPTMRNPGDTSNVFCIKEAMRASLELADEMKFKKIAVPGMGTGIGGVSHEDSAKSMIEILEKFEPQNLKEVVLVDIDEDMVKAWSALLG